MKPILYYISGHGFGHAVRSALVIRELYRRGMESHIVTSAPRFIFDCNLRGVPFHYHFLESDIGVRQRGSLEVDLPSTVTAWEECLARKEEWLAGQLTLCREIRPAAVVSDIVPFAFPLARRAGLPSFLLATFTWDWILNFYREEDPRFGRVAERLHEAYLEADHLIYTPLSFALPPVKNQSLVPLIGNRSCSSREDLRLDLGLDARPVYLLSFGGFGVREIDKMRLEDMKEYQFLFLGEREERKGNIVIYPQDKIRHEDLVSVSRAVITKPGYGVSSEAILNRVPMIHTSRGKFAEYEPLVAALRRYIPLAYISQEELFQGGLRSYIEYPLKFSEDLLTDSGRGAEGAAEVIVAGGA